MTSHHADVDPTGSVIRIVDLRNAPVDVWFAGDTVRIQLGPAGWHESIRCDLATAESLLDRLAVVVAQAKAAS